MVLKILLPVYTSLGNSWICSYKRRVKLRKRHGSQKTWNLGREEEGNSQNKAIQQLQR
jgi:hypothetical protein